MSLKLLKLGYMLTLANRYLFAKILSWLIRILGIKENGWLLKVALFAVNVINYLLIVPLLLIPYIGSRMLVKLNDEEKCLAKMSARKTVSEKICPAIWLFEI